MHIAWLKSELLHPLDKGGRIRSYHLLRALSGGHRITYFALDDGTITHEAMESATEYATRVIRVPHATPTRRSPRFYAALAANAASTLPYAIARYRSSAMAGALAALVQQDRPDVVVADFLAMAPNVVRMPVPTLLFQHNVEAEIWRRHSETAHNPLTAAFFRAQWLRMERYEAEACRRFDHVVAVSEHDATLFRARHGAASVSVVQTGVDTDYFRPSGAISRDPQTLAFTGSMDWLPNEEGITAFVREVLPAVRRQVPDARVLIVGRRPGPALLRLGSAVPGVEVTGDVPDVRPYLARATAAVVPLRVGGGTRLKIYEAMAMECPIVSTTVGAEGLPVRDGEHYLRADTTDELAAACVQLLTNAASARQLATRASEYVRTHFAWAGVADGFVVGCDAAISRYRNGSLPVTRVS